MAGARVEDDVGTALGKPCARAISHPSVAADFHADLYAATVEQQIADRIGVAVDGHLSDVARGPRCEPTWLVMNAIAGQMLLADEAEQSAIAAKGHDVVKHVVD